ncbi:MAG: LacI family DNA-binding transcriptional regulator [Rubrobacteraceae bacterium]
MKDVAERAGVSASTVSHVMNGTRKVSDGAREGVLSAIEELGYRPNLLAKGLKTRRTFTVGLLISDIQNPFFTSVVRGVEDVALSRGYHLFLCNTDEDPSREDEYITELANKGVDGLIVASSAPRHNHASRLRAENVPFVFMDREVEGVDADAIRVDNRLGMRLIAEHLTELGHERIAMISGPLDRASGHERYRGLKDALAEPGPGLDDALVRFGDFRTSSGQEGARELLSLTPPPTALVTANNQMTLGALLEIRDLGLRIPEDVSVVGFDDAEWASLVSPPLTTLAQPTYELGVRAMRLLLKRIEDPDGDMERLLLEPELVVRESTAPPAGKGGKG